MKCGMAVANVLMAAALASAGACYHAAPEAPHPVLKSSGQRHDSALNRFPGIYLAPIGRSAFLIKIHSGIVGFGEPIYVIDGAVMTISPHRGIDWFKPEDIAQIKVLKRPEELAVYGPRGVNGVIVINTKQAAGKSGFAY